MRMIFVCGVLPEDSGKTTFCRAFVRYLRTKNFSVVPFKPLSAHSVWWQYEHYLRCIELRSIVSQDAYELWIESSCPELRIPIEMINPCDMLISVPDMEVLTKTKVEIRGMVTPSGPFTWFYAGRFTLWNEKPEHVFYRREARSLLRPKPDIVDVIGRERFLVVRNEYEFMKLHERYYSRAVASCFSRVAEAKPDFVVIESFNDCVYPWRGVRDSDIVIAISPSFAVVYGPNEFFNAVLGTSDPYLCTYAVIAPDVDPLDVFRIKPLKREILRDTCSLLKEYSPLFDKIMKEYLCADEPGSGASARE